MMLDGLLSRNFITFRFTWFFSEKEDVTMLVIGGDIIVDK